jgi:hypothetical protein
MTRTRRMNMKTMIWMTMLVAWVTTISTIIVTMKIPSCQRVKIDDGDDTHDELAYGIWVS